MGKTVKCKPTTSSSAASLRDQVILRSRKDMSRVVASESSTPPVEPSSRKARVTPSQRRLDAATLEEALSLMGFNPRLLCHFLRGRRAAALRLALSITNVDLDTEQEHSVPRQTLSAARCCLEAGHIDKVASEPITREDWIEQCAARFLACGCSEFAAKDCAITEFDIQCCDEALDSAPELPCDRWPDPREAADDSMREWEGDRDE